MAGKGADMQRFWDRKAKKYPMPFDEHTLSRTLRVINIVKTIVSEMQGTHVLDIGCGTGIFTLPLALETANVTGIDLSGEMVARLREQALQRGINNVTSMISSWEEIDIDKNGWRGGFDIVWASMTAAVRTRVDIEKMELCTRRWCVYIGWGNKREDALMEQAFALHGLKYGPPPGAKAVHEILSQMGRIAYRQSLEDSWTWQGTVEEAVEDVAGHIEINDVSADRDKLLNLINGAAEDGIVRHTTYAEKTLIVWEV